MEKFMPGWQFKNLTIDSKIFYSSMICILFWFMLIILNGCTSSIYKVRKENINDRVKVTHVLAITEMGDTLKIPIEDIKPRVIYNVIGYVNSMANPYYRPYIYNYDYYPYNYNYNNNLALYHYYNSGNNQPVKQSSSWKPIPIKPNNGSSSNTSGFSGKPVASNPVTNSGGTKKKN